MKPNLETGWLEWLQVGPDRGSEAKLERIFEITSVMPQRRAWSSPASWLFELPQLGPSARLLAYVIFVLLLVVALAVGVLGSRPPLPRPFGLAANGLLAVEAGGTIMLVNPDGSGLHVIDSGDGRSLSPRYSPDGTHLVFWSQPADGTPLSLYVASADGRGIRKISGGLAIETDSAIAPSWSPDSTQVVFATETDHNGILGDGPTTLYTVAVDGHAQPVPVTSAGGYHSPSWSPDGNWIAYAYPKPPTRNWLAIAHPDGSGERWLHRQPALNAENEPSFAEGLAWTVDSRRIAFVRGSDVSNPAEQRGSAYLVAIDLDGHEQVVFSQSGGFLESPSWSPDDQWLAFIGGENSRMTFVIKPDGSQLRQIGACTDSDGLTWSPDGKLLVVTCGTSSEIVPVDHPEAAYDAPVQPGATVADWQRIVPTR